MATTTTTTDNKPDLDGMRAKHSAATPGTWRHSVIDMHGEGVYHYIDTEDHPGEHIETEPQNIEFYCHAHEHLPALLTAYRELEREVERATRRYMMAEAHLDDELREIADLRAALECERGGSR